MKEIDVQSLILDSVKQSVGAGHKLSNRFMIGVSDLLIKLPLIPAALIEVKLQQIGASTSDSHEFALDVTVLQQDFLQKYFDAGMWTGVFSFVERGRKGVRGLSMALFELDAIKLRGYRVAVADHIAPAPHPNRESSIAAYLMKELTSERRRI